MSQHSASQAFDPYRDTVSADSCSPRQRMREPLRLGAWQALGAVLAGLVLGCMVSSVAIGLMGAAGQPIDFKAWGEALTMAPLMTLVTVPFGLLPALVYGWPAYHLLARSGRANWVTVTAAGALPGAVMLGLSEHGHEIALLFGGYILACAWCTHAFAAWWWLRRGQPTASDSVNQPCSVATECVQTHSNPEADPREPDA